MNHIRTSYRGLRTIPRLIEKKNSFFLKSLPRKNIHPLVINSLQHRCLHLKGRQEKPPSDSISISNTDDASNLQELKKKSKIQYFAKLTQTDDFKKKLTKYLIIIYAIFIYYGLTYMQKLYKKEKELVELEKKLESEGNDKLTLEEQLRLKEWKGELSYKERHQLFQIRYPELSATKGIDSALEAYDTTQFYDSVAEDYDKQINKEERFIGIKSKRKWVMRQATGDVLEVSCGTGRNVPYLKASDIRSITYVDSSLKMIELTRDRFKKKYPNFKNVAFVQRKAEDLVKSNESSQEGAPQMKYDTIVETFGLCSHEDPVNSLKNFAKLLKPNGKIVLLEHGRGDYQFINKILDKRAKPRLEKWGCRWNLDIEELLGESGLKIKKVSRSHFGTTWCITAMRAEDDVNDGNDVPLTEKYWGIKKQ
ncbi:hypothetical protein TBLA_0A03070 [Henningerozyma blattae CBS 6284]|uniref:Methyltransferase domain-containing protein n=1 Tax=Henningerozyma blattae (strain ATCC 34711 / CBS 6284 / DSM 70876 / NBRC 10599 / NRRL Y-10934 / UCD 77-7) TaxID=1071380 RepID=I2GVF5_HENB6|nr:hypothetical protein TBLA_0A03070 [Tetrapisispora blattae CBS 6284]CCH58107.1 hypothetical protein TBLA_0A03070 [Tetrapisispora blattae CBS 6284]